MNGKVHGNLLCYDLRILFPGKSSWLLDLLVAWLSSSLLVWPYRRPQNSQKFCVLLWIQEKRGSNTHTHTHTLPTVIWQDVRFDVFRNLKFNTFFYGHNWFKLPWFHVKNYKSFASLYHPHTSLGKKKI